MITSLIADLCVGSRASAECEYKLNGREIAVVLVALAVVGWFIATSRSASVIRHRSRFGKKLQKVDLAEARRSQQRRRWWRRQRRSS